MVKIMELTAVKECLVEAVQLFVDGEDTQARAMLEDLDITDIVECLNCYPFEGMEQIATCFDLVKCEDCGDWVYDEETTWTADGMLVCTDCIDNSYVYIESEDKLYHVDDCYECPGCGEWFLDDSNNSVDILDDDGNIVCTVCQDCAENNYYFWDSDDEWHNEPKHESEYITDYHDDRRNFYFGHVENGELVQSSTPNCSKLYLGFELEMYHKGYDNLVDHDPLAETLQGQFDIDCTEDGSLSEGFEVITNPMTLEAHIKAGTVNIPQIARNKGYRGHQGYGLHIHINRDYLNDMEQCALVYSVNRNWQDFMPFSLRADSRWCQANPDIELWGCNKGYNDHSALINVGNANTVEFRGFRNTTNKTHLIACLQLVVCFVLLIKQQMECSMMNVKTLARQRGYKELTFEIAIR